MLSNQTQSFNRTVETLFGINLPDNRPGG